MTQKYRDVVLEGIGSATGVTFWLMVLLSAHFLGWTTVIVVVTIRFLIDIIGKMIYKKYEHRL